MNARSDLRLAPGADLRTAIRYARISRRLRAKLLTRALPAVSATFGVVSFLMCGAAVVAMATVAALQIQ